MKSVPILVFLFLAFSFSQDVYLHFGEHDTLNQTLEIWIDPDVPVSGLQFTVTGFHVTEAILGADSGSFFLLSHNEDGLILLFGMESTILMYDHLFCTIYYDAILNPLSCIEDVLIAGSYGQLIEDVDVADCIETTLCSPPGDMNQDTVLDVSDIIMIVDCILLYENCPCANLNEDEIVDIRDIVAAINLIMGD